MKKNSALVLFKSILLLAVFGFCLPSQAQTVNDLGELSFGEQYSVPVFQVTNGYFTAPVTNTLTVSFTPGSYKSCLYYDSDFEEEVPGNFNNDYMNPAINYKVTEGETYYVHFDNVYDPIRFTLFMQGVNNLPFKVSYYEPTSGRNRVYSLTDNPEMFVRYSQYISSVEVNFEYQSNGGDMLETDITDNARIQEDYVFIAVASVLENLLNDDSDAGIKPNAPFTVNVKVTNENGDFVNGSDSEGWISYPYLCGYIPTRLVSAHWPEEFLSYWPAGDEAGIGYITYSTPLRESPAPTAMLLMSSADRNPEAESYRSSVRTQVEGDKIIVDLTGVRRSLEDMFTTPPEDLKMSIQINNIYNELGTPVESNVQGVIGGYIVVLPYVDLPKTNVFSDWTPVNGSNLASQSEIEVWITGLNSIQFDGFTFEYTIDGTTDFITVSNEDVKISDETSNGNEAVFTFAIPDVVKNAESVKVYPAGLISLNGYEYMTYLTASYNTLVATMVNPANGAELDALTDKTVEAVFNYSAFYPEMFVTLEVIDQNPTQGADATILPVSAMTFADGMYTLKIDEKTVLYRNHEYQAMFRVWEDEAAYTAGQPELSKTSVTWFGTSIPYANSDLRFTGITPDGGVELVATEGKFTMNFDGLVRIDPQFSFYIPDGLDPMKFTLTPTGDYIFNNVDDGMDYCAQWLLEVNEAYIDRQYSEMTLTVVVVDEEGRRLKGNVGTGEDTYFEFIYQNTPSTGIDYLNATSNGVFTVVNLQGVKVMETTDRNDLKSLAPGIYIVNGTKIKI